MRRPIIKVYPDCTTINFEIDNEQECVKPRRIEVEVDGRMISLQWLVEAFKRQEKNNEL